MIIREQKRGQLHLYIRQNDKFIQLKSYVLSVLAQSDRVGCQHALAVLYLLETAQAHDGSYWQIYYGFLEIQNKKK